MSKKKENTNWGLGCAVQIVACMIVACIVDSDRLADLLAFAMLLGIPSIILRFFLRRSELSTPWVERLLGPLLFVVALVLSYVVPLGVGTDVETNDLPKKASAQEESLSIESDPRTPPPGVRCTPPDANNITTLEEAIAQLDDLIGLEPVKEEVRKFANYVSIAKQREAAGLKVASLTYHMAFSGNPGTGKTTVARIMADIYRTLGIVSRGQLVECDRGGLIGEYVGQTAIKTSAVIDYALDGVLFIDEAYAIVDEHSGGYGAECIATLLKRMEDDRDRLVVIVAGYTEEMKHFMDANPGLKSRINRHIEFPDYSAEELATIFRKNAEKNNYSLSPEADAHLEEWIRNATQTRNRQFGNARWARNLLDDAIVRQANRLAQSNATPSRKDLITLLPEDIGIAP